MYAIRSYYVGFPEGHPPGIGGGIAVLEAQHAGLGQKAVVNAEGLKDLAEIYSRLGKHRKEAHVITSYSIHYTKLYE